MSREVHLRRKTSETEIEIRLNLDAQGQDVDTGIGFLDHMLTLFARHGFFALTARATGDLAVDSHHTTEDIGILLGEALKQALGDKSGIRRYGQSLLPMDETLVLCAVDLSGRAYLNYAAAYTAERLGSLETEMLEEFFRAVAGHAGLTLHLKVLDGQNNHHMAEALFKAFGRALGEAVSYDPRVEGALSTKGTLA